MLTRPVDLQSAWVLHARPYRETSLIVDLLTQDYGKISVVANGARGAASKKGRPRRGQLLQPFAELLVSWSGRSELKTLKALEQRRVIPLAGIRLFSGLYANELLQRLLLPWQPVEGLVGLYIWLLEYLAADTHLERLLRLFEKQLLELLGYGLPLAFEAGSSNHIDAQSWYRYDPANGFWPVTKSEQGASGQHFSGALLHALAEHRLEDHFLGPAKQLMRQAVRPYLGERSLRSRELFQVVARTDNKIGE